MTAQDAKEWAINLSKDWVHWMQSSDSIDIVTHLSTTSGGVNTIVDRVLQHTALMYAAGVGDVKLVEKLCEHPDTLCQCEDIFGETALDISLKHSYFIIAGLLLKKMIADTLPASKTNRSYFFK